MRIVGSVVVYVLIVSIYVIWFVWIVSVCSYIQIQFQHESISFRETMHRMETVGLMWIAYR